MFLREREMSRRSVEDPAGSKDGKVGRKDAGNVSLPYHGCPQFPLPLLLCHLLPQPAAAPLPKYPALFILLVTAKGGDQCLEEAKKGQVGELTSPELAEALYKRVSVS